MSTAAVRFYKWWEVLLKFWRVEFSEGKLWFFTPFFAVVIYDNVPDIYQCRLITGIQVVWGFEWSKGLEHGAIMFRHERWFRKSENATLLEVRSRG